MRFQAAARAPVRVRPVPTPTTNWIPSNQTAGTEGLRHPKEHTGPRGQTLGGRAVPERSIAQNKYAIDARSAAWARGKCSVPGRIISFLLS